MADSDDPKAEASAEKAYAAAAEAAGDKADPSNTASTDSDAEADGSAEPVEFPAKPKRARKPRETEGAVDAIEPSSEPALDDVPLPDEVEAKAEPAPVIEPEPVVEPVPVVKVAPVTESAPVVAPKPRPARAAATPATPPQAAKPVAKPAVKRAAASPAPTTPAPIIPAPTKAASVEMREPATEKTKTAYKAAPQPAKDSNPAAPTSSLIAQLKEIPMDVTNSIKEAVNGAQEKAKEAYNKGSAFAGEYTDFAKGNVEAFVESGKILAAGLQDLGNNFLTESKTAFETATSDVKALTSVKSPSDFFKLQTDLLRRNFDNAVAYSSKTGEAMIKLTGDVIAPLSSRVNLAVEKVKKAA